MVDEGENPEYVPYCWSFLRPLLIPHGMIREAALRELQEETGYGGDGEGAGKATVEDVSPLLVSL